MIPETQIFKHPLLVTRLLALKRITYKRIVELDCSYIKDVEPIAYDNILKRQTEFKTIKKGETWGKAYDCAIFHIWGKIPENYKDKNLFIVFDFEGEAFYLDENFNPYFSVNSRLSIMDYFQFSWNLRIRKLTEIEKEKGFIDCYLDASFNGKIIQPFGKARFFSAYISQCNEQLREYYFDYLHFSYLYCSLENEKLRRKLLDILNESYYLLKKSNFSNILEARQLLSQAYHLSNNKPTYEISAIGQAHLDMAWLWPLRETKRKSVRTYINTINLIENYPFYIFGTSQPQQLEWIKQLYPKIYDKIKTYILKGNIELQGGMWVEADCNLPSGESLVRQILFGKKYFKQEFGINVKTCWLVDAFGFPASLPQILKKSGLDYFCTIKLFWNNFNKFPHTTFLWEGIDGSKVLAHMPPEGTYTSEATAISIKQSETQFKEKNIINSFLLVFGNGDGGGGPQTSHLELLKRYKNTQYTPELTFEKAIDFFTKIEKFKDKLPIYKGELYLEKHQGTLTTQAKNKLFNRKIEIKLHNLEVLATLAYINGYNYPSTFFEEIYKEVLLYQFHDILPGSSVKRVYDETTNRYNLLFEKCEKLQDVLVDFLSSNFMNAQNNNIQKSDTPKNEIEKNIASCNKNIDINSNNNEKITYGINLTGFSRKEYIKQKENWFYVNLEPYSASILEKYDISENSTPNLFYGDDFIENDLLLLKFAKDGSICFLLDKKNKKQICGKFLNRLILYKDKWLFYNAWDIDFNYRKKPKKVLKEISHICFIDGPKVIRRNIYKYKKTKIVMDTILTENSNLIEFSLDIEFYEKFKMLRTEFNPCFFSEEVTCEIQFGVIKRSTLDNDPISKAQFEICAHKFVDVSNENYGLALLNDSKYGHRVKNGIISLNLLRSPIYPDKTADRGKHHIRYALYPHINNFENSDVTQTAILFNNEPILVSKRLSFESIIKSDTPNIVIDTIKKAENSNGVIVRLYESIGKTCKAKIKTSFNYNNTYEVDLLENIIKPIKIDELDFSPFEIKTLLFEL